MGIAGSNRVGVLEREVDSFPERIYRPAPSLAPGIYDILMYFVWSVEGRKVRCLFFWVVGG
jgi:hypothetical protein